MKFNEDCLGLYRQEIESYAFSLSENEIEDFSKIFYVLSNVEVVTARFCELEEDIFNDAKRKRIFDKIDLFKDFINLNVPTKFNLLSDVLYTWAIKNKIDLKFAKINRLLDGSKFLFLLSRGSFFKDIGVPPEHGPWTHFLQWYIIFETNNIDKFLNNDPYSLYKKLGKIISKNKKTPLWYICCDRAAKKDEPFDFRSPDNLHKFIKENTIQKFSFLSILLQKGFKNKSIFDKNIPDVEFKDYENDNRLILSRF